MRILGLNAYHGDGSPALRMAGQPHQALCRLVPPSRWCMIHGQTAARTPSDVVMTADNVVDPQTNQIDYEYPYHDSVLGCAHSYIAPKLLELLGTTRRLRVLDLGCGNGSLSHLISTRGHQVVGIDHSESGIALARGHFPDCQFLQASLYDLPLDRLEGSFDVVMAVEVIEHLLYPRELVRAAEKMLRPGGRLIISTPYHGYFKYLALAASGKMDRHMTALWDGGHVKFFSPKTLTALLRSEGFTKLSFSFVGRLPLLWESMLCTSVNPKRQVTADAQMFLSQKHDNDEHSRP